MEKNYSGICEHAFSIAWHVRVDEYDKCRTDKYRGASKRGRSVPITFRKDPCSARGSLAPPVSPRPDCGGRQLSQAGSEEVANPRRYISTALLAVRRKSRSRNYPYMTYTMRAQSWESKVFTKKKRRKKEKEKKAREEGQTASQASQIWCERSQTWGTVAARAIVRFLIIFRQLSH